MPLETISFNDKEYLKLQSTGNAARFIIPFAKELCNGVGYDIGCNRVEWSLPGSTPIDLTFNNGYDAKYLPEELVDYIFSSHTLEHISDWVGVLNYWLDKIKVGGVIFLYLPDYSQEYWRPWNNRKHINVLNKDVIIDFFKSKNVKKIFYGDVDLNNSFTIVIEK
jgi:predicted SAM-dependent methyltransferase